MALWMIRLLCTMAGEGIAPLALSLIRPRGSEMSRRTTWSNQLYKQGHYSTGWSVCLTGPGGGTGLLQSRGGSVPRRGRTLTRIGSQRVPVLVFGGFAGFNYRSPAGACEAGQPVLRRQGAGVVAGPEGVKVARRSALLGALRRCICGQGVFNRLFVLRGSHLCAVLQVIDDLDGDLVVPVVRANVGNHARVGDVEL
jgi:hypothetical protein